MAAQVQAETKERAPKKPSYTFDDGSRLSQDTCALAARGAANDSVFEYVTSNFRPADGHIVRTEFALNHPNLRPVDGYGVAPPHSIDTDSDFRANPDRGVSLEERREPLNTRVFHAAPSLWRGEALPTLEHVLIAGQPAAACGPTPGTLSTVESEMPPLHPTVEQLVRIGAQATDAWSLQFGEPSREALRKMRAGVPQLGCAGSFV